MAELISRRITCIAKRSSFCKLLAAVALLATKP
jgi:hypothetical protein